MTCIITVKLATAGAWQTHPQSTERQATPKQVERHMCDTMMVILFMVVELVILTTVHNA